MASASKASIQVTSSGRLAALAMDQRGYNESDAPEGPEAYRMANLVGEQGLFLLQKR